MAPKYPFLKTLNDISSGLLKRQEEHSAAADQQRKRAMQELSAMSARAELSSLSQLHAREAIDAEAARTTDLEAGTAEGARRLRTILAGAADALRGRQ